MPQVTDVMIFELQPGMDDDGFLRLAHEASAVLKASGGFISRLLSREGTQWIDIVQWETLDDALRADATVSGRVEVQAFSAAMAPGAISLRNAAPENPTAH